MLIYNHKKEFIGIDELDLNTLGFNSLEELNIEAPDFADLFVKTPGYVHNFKHISWIDFVACADSTESTKAIINAKNKNFRCLLDVKIIYLNEKPSSKAFVVHLNNIRELMDNEDLANLSSVKPIARPTPKPIPTPETIITPMPTPSFILPTIEETLPKEKGTSKTINIPDDIHTPIDLDLSLDIDLKDDLIKDSDLDKEMKESKKIEEVIIEETQQHSEIFNNGYTYDPQVASDELGLPVDLIEEFIEDFIAQAKEFQKELYVALDTNDNDNIKILSHKLKGVAANLRIEDALEHLSIINTSQNLNEIKTHTDIFYNIIAKLADEKILVTKSVEVNSNTLSESSEISKVDELEEFILESKTKLDEDLDIFLQAEPELTVESSIESNKSQEGNELEELSLKTQTKEEDLDIFLQAEPEISEDDISVGTLEIPEEDTKISNYDTNLVASEIGLSQENFIELFQDYLNEAKELSTTISKAIQDNNQIKWSNTALQLKGMSDNMRINDMSTDLNILIQTQDIEIAENAISKIIQALEALSNIEE